MIKNLLPIIITVFLYVFSFAQVTDIPPNAKPNYRAVTGGSIKVKIDTVSSLTTLINKLDSNWEFIETGKMYWIGYTDDMYSIAIYKDSAIEPLVEHFHSTKSEKGKYGVIYTLHLIGIESSIAGRFIEEFKNKNARQALLQLATDKKYTGVIVSLLARDPWKTDLPALVELLKRDNHSIELVNAIFRYTTIPYKENDVPFRQSIPQSIDTFNVLMQDSLMVFQIGTLIKISKQEANKIEKGSSGNRQILAVNNKPSVIVQLGYGATITYWKFILNDHEIQKINSYFKCSPQELIAYTCEPIETFLDRFLSLSWEKIDPFSYMGLGGRFQHYIENNNLIICTIEQSAKRWLEYFAIKR